VTEHDAAEHEDRGRRNECLKTRQSRLTRPSPLQYSRALLLSLTILALPWVFLPSADAAGAATPAQAVSLLVRLDKPCWLHWSPPAGPHPPMSPSLLRTCAITPRLERELLRSGVGWDGFCLCPAQLGRPYVSRQQVRQITNNGSVAQVETRWFFGAIWYTSAFVVLRQQKRWLVDGVSCARHPSKSSRRRPLSVCVPTIPRDFHPRGTATALQAVSAVVSPFWRHPHVSGTCHPDTGMVYTCPLTLRLLRYLALPSAAAVSFCHCQNPPTSTRSRQIDENGRMAHVNVGWYYGGQAPPYTTTFALVRGGSGWLVDDQYCAGKPGTSIYRTAVPPCV
jgi:hypothetical protein